MSTEPPQLHATVTLGDESISNMFCNANHWKLCKMIDIWSSCSKHTLCRPFMKLPKIPLTAFSRLASRWCDVFAHIYEQRSFDLFMLSDVLCKVYFSS